MRIIKRIRLSNFKRFEDFEVDFNDNINVLIGDNEAGKSSLLTAIELVISGSKNKVDSIGLESIFSTKAVKNFSLASAWIKQPLQHLATPRMSLEEQEREARNIRSRSAHGSRHSPEKLGSSPALRRIRA